MRIPNCLLHIQLEKGRWNVLENSDPEVTLLENLVFTLCREDPEGSGVHSYLDYVFFSRDRCGTFQTILTPTIIHKLVSFIH